MEKKVLCPWRHHWASGSTQDSTLLASYNIRPLLFEWLLMGYSLMMLSSKASWLIELWMKNNCWGNSKECAFRSKYPWKKRKLRQTWDGWRGLQSPLTMREKGLGSCWAGGLPGLPTARRWIKAGVGSRSHSGKALGPGAVIGGKQFSPWKSKRQGQHSITALVGWWRWKKQGLWCQELSPAIHLSRASVSLAIKWGKSF